CGTATIAVELRADPTALRLVVRRGLPQGASAALRGTLVLGRAPACDLVLADPKVSRRHLEIVCGETILARDLGSANGTRLGGRPFRDGPLGCGDRLELGDCELLVEDEPGA
ncbi:MAG: FHA domain-containing protein, partial [Vulcanimicrobiaceae bacterium]